MQTAALPSFPFLLSASVAAGARMVHSQDDDESGSGHRGHDAWLMIQAYCWRWWAWMQLLVCARPPNQAVSWLACVD
jgi:hypothetical protein